MRKLKIMIGLILIIVALLCVFTNPTEHEYITFMEEVWGRPPASFKVEIERINFVLFSTYTPIIGLEHGKTYLVIMNQFIQISDGQFDYPKWLELFNGNRS